jgi:hypothetical protein
MAKPVLYVSLHGPILVPALDEQDVFLGKKIAPYAKPFLHWAKEHFDVRWLSETGARDAIYTASRLSLPADAIPVATFEDSKVENMSPRENFYWIDGALIPSEAAWLHEHRCEDRLLQVDPYTGVTPAHKEKLQQKLMRR